MPVDKFFFGTSGDDRGATALRGTDSSSFVDHIHGLDGNDELFGYRGADLMFGGDGDDLFNGGSGVDFIQGGAGFDTLTYASSNAAVNVHLGTGAASGGDASGDSFAQIEALTGSRFNDVLTGSDTGTNILSGGRGNDTLRGSGGFDLLEGGKGNDVIDGGTGFDALWGGAGADRFAFHIPADAPASGFGHDFIGDFSRSQNDKIDLSGLGTNSGDARFDFIGTSSFFEAGQVRFLKDGGSTIVQVNTDGDAQAEMDIHLTGSFNLNASDFLL